MICAIVLAAGYSRRMGTQKLLLPLGEKTVISHIVDQVLASRVDAVYVIVGHQANEVTRELSGKPISVIRNPGYQSGMLSSVRAGLTGLPQECRGIFVILGDQPSIATELINQMIASFSSAEKKIIVPLHAGKRGHPILFSSMYRDEIFSHYDEVGLRGILQAHPDDICEMGVSNPAVLTDMDDPQDYQREILAHEKKEKN